MHFQSQCLPRFFRGFFVLGNQADCCLGLCKSLVLFEEQDDSAGRDFRHLLKSARRPEIVVPAPRDGRIALELFLVMRISLSREPVKGSKRMSLPEELGIQPEVFYFFSLESR